MNYARTFRDQQQNLRNLFLDSLQNLWQEFPQGVYAIIGNTFQSSYAKSDTAFGREFIGFSDGKFGTDIPRQWDGTYFDRVSQGGPGASPTVADGGAGNISAGAHQWAVIFVTRQGAVTKYSVPITFTHGGAKQAALTAIPTGPPNVIGRIIAATTVGGSAFFYIPNTSMVITDNTTTTATIDFTDLALQNGVSVDLYADRVELGEVAGMIHYNGRMVAWGERNKIPNFVTGSLGFDGGFGGGAGVPANVGPNSPSAGVSDAALGGTAWANPGNALVADGVLATAAIPVATFNSQYLKVSGFGFAIPANATITGILVKALVKGSDGVNLSDFSVVLYKGGLIVGSDHANGNIWTTSLAYQNYGSSSDLWNATWIPGDLNAANFAVGYAAANNAASGTKTASADYISVTVYYTTPGVATTPLGWTAGASIAGGGSALAGPFPVHWGDAFAITGDGATPIRGQVTQSAYQDYLKVPIIKANTAYRVRARIASAGGLANGTIHVNLQSTSGAFTTAGLAVQANQATAAYKEFDALLTTSVVNPPTDLLLQVYADGTPNNGGVFLVDSVEVYPANQPNNLSQVRVSNAQDPEAFQGVTGFLNVSENDDERVVGCFVMRERLYIVKQNGIFVTKDDGLTEPSGWTVSTVSTTIGAASINSFGNNIGEQGADWVLLVHRNGLYIFFGTEPIKISQEVQISNGISSFSWDAVNWRAGHTTWLVLDNRERRCLVGLPMGAATSPSMTLMFDFRALGNAEAIATTPLVHMSAYTNKQVALSGGRKYCPWTIVANCGALIERNDGTAHLFLGSGVANGWLYDLLDGQFTDNGVNIPMFYQTAYLPSDEQKQTMEMTGTRVLLSYLRQHVTGSGNLSATVYGPGNVNSTAIPGTGAPLIVLSSPASRDVEQFVDFRAERISILIQPTGAAGSGPWISAQKLELWLSVDPVAPLLGFN